MANFTGIDFKADETYRVSSVIDKNNYIITKIDNKNYAIFSLYQAAGSIRGRSTGGSFDPRNTKEVDQKTGETSKINNVITLGWISSSKKENYDYVLTIKELANGKGEEETVCNVKIDKKNEDVLRKILGSDPSDYSYKKGGSGEKKKVRRRDSRDSNYYFVYNYKPDVKDKTYIILDMIKLEDDVNVFQFNEEEHSARYGNLLKPRRFKDLLKSVKAADIKVEEQEKNKNPEEEEEEVEYEAEKYTWKVSLYDFIDKQKLELLEKDNQNKNESVFFYNIGGMKVFNEAGQGDLAENDGEENKKEEEKGSGIIITFQKPKYTYGIDALRMKVDVIGDESETIDGIKFSDSKIYIAKKTRTEIMKLVDEFYNNYKDILLIKKQVDEFKDENGEEKYNFKKQHEDIKALIDIVEKSERRLNGIYEDRKSDEEANYNSLELYRKMKRESIDSIKNIYSELIKKPEYKDLNKVFNEQTLNDILSESINKVLNKKNPIQETNSIKTGITKEDIKISLKNFIQEYTNLTMITGKESNPENVLGFKNYIERLKSSNIIKKVAEKYIETIGAVIEVFKKGGEINITNIKSEEIDFVFKGVIENGYKFQGIQNMTKNLTEIKDFYNKQKEKIQNNEYFSNNTIKNDVIEKIDALLKEQEAIHNLLEIEGQENKTDDPDEVFDRFTKKILNEVKENEEEKIKDISKLKMVVDCYMMGYQYITTKLQKSKEDNIDNIK